MTIAVENLPAGPVRTRNLICPNRNFEEKKTTKKTDSSYIYITETF